MMLLTIVLALIAFYLGFPLLVMAFAILIAIADAITDWTSGMLAIIVKAVILTPLYLILDAKEWIKRALADRV